MPLVSRTALWDRSLWAAQEQGGIISVRYGASNAEVVRFIPLWAIHFRVGLNDSFGSLPTQNVL